MSLHTSALKLSGNSLQSSLFSPAHFAPFKEEISFVDTQAISNLNGRFLFRGIGCTWIWICSASNQPRWCLLILDLSIRSRLKCRIQCRQIVADLRRSAMSTRTKMSRLGQKQTAGNNQPYFLLKYLSVCLYYREDMHEDWRRFLGSIFFSRLAGLVPCFLSGGHLEQLFSIQNRNHEQRPHHRPPRTLFDISDGLISWCPQTMMGHCRTDDSNAPLNGRPLKVHW